MQTEVKLSSPKQVKPLVKILIVDDCSVSSAVIKAYFEAIDNTVCVCVNSPSKGYDLACSDEFDIIFLDNYFDVPGEETTSYLQGSDFWAMHYKRKAKTAIIVGISANVFKQSKFISQGADLFLAKPVSKKDLDYLVAKSEAQKNAQT